MKYKVINRTFSPMQIIGVGVIPARKFVIMDEIPKTFRTMQKNNKIDIKVIK